jgi:hypothetical protein
MVAGYVGFQLIRLYAWWTGHLKKPPWAELQYEGFLATKPISHKSILKSLLSGVSISAKLVSSQDFSRIGLYKLTNRRLMRRLVGRNGVS